MAAGVAFYQAVFDEEAQAANPKVLLLSAERHKSKSLCRRRAPSNAAAVAVPKGMPRQSCYTDGTREYLFEIKAWRLNHAGGPKVDEFASPEDRPGWEVVDVRLIEPTDLSD